jgi:hypothetical protein
MRPQSVLYHDTPNLDGSSYTERLRSTVQSLICACHSFFEICSKAQGASPHDVLGQLQTLYSESPNTKLAQLLATATEDEAQPNLCFSQLENLLIDYDWRFNKPTAERLRRLLQDFESVACVGSPTVFALLRSRTRRDILVDQNSYYQDILDGKDGSIISQPIERWDSGALSRSFPAIMLDPPWYLDSYQTWITASIPLLQSGGTMFLPVFPRLVRPTAQREFAILMDRLASLGSITILPIRAHYETPTFERECLRQLDLPPLHGWRSAKLVAVRVFHPDKPKNWTAKSTPHHEWIRYRFGAQVVAIKRRPEAARSETTTGDVFFLDSVSERDSRRQQLTAISSRNMASNSQFTSNLERQLQLIERSKSRIPGDLLVEAANMAGKSHA